MAARRGVLAAGRRTVTGWIRAAGLSGEFRPCYTTVAAAGSHAAVAARLAHAVAKPLVAGAARLTFALDDTPTERYVLAAVADRFALETCFRDVKEVVGAGRQQVRRVRASVGAFHLCLWAFTLTEAWAWGQEHHDLAGHRAASPWDDGARRPSHADKRRAWRRQLLAAEIHAALRPGQTEGEIRDAAERLLNLAA